MDLENIKISLHSKERYAERIMGRDNKTDIAVFLLEQDEKIKTDITKMIEYGTLIYSGKPTSDIFNRQPVDIYLNGTWVIIVDTHKNNVITLYSIDLGLGKDFNEEYITLLLNKLKEAQAALKTIEEDIEANNEIYKNLIVENETSISEYKRIIKSLEEQNRSYWDIIDHSDASRIIADKEVRDIVATLIGKKVF